MNGRCRTNTNGLFSDAARRSVALPGVAVHYAHLLRGASAVGVGRASLRSAPAQPLHESVYLVPRAFLVAEAAVRLHHRAPLLVARRAVVGRLRARLGRHGSGYAVATEWEGLGSKS